MGLKARKLIASWPALGAAAALAVLLLANALLTPGSTPSSSSWRGTPTRSPPMSPVNPAV